MKAKLILTALSLCAALFTGHVYAKGSPIETVYTLSNDPTKNSVLAFQRDDDGYFEVINVDMGEYEIRVDGRSVKVPTHDEPNPSYRIILPVKPA